MRKNKGITLVALVITIIILLILAGITIAQLTGNGLFENAKIAKEKSENAQEKEETTLGDYTNAILDYSSINNTRDSYSTNFSTEEQVIGTWEDGRNIYQKTFLFDEKLSSSKDIDIDLKNVDIVFVSDVGSYGIYYPSGTSGSKVIMPINFYHGNTSGYAISMSVSVSNDKIQAAFRLGSNYASKVTLKALTFIYIKAE